MKLASLLAVAGFPTFKSVPVHAEFSNVADIPGVVGTVAGISAIVGFPVCISVIFLLSVEGILIIRLAS
jgi:hypothetical protein